MPTCAARRCIASSRSRTSSVSTEGLKARDERQLAIVEISQYLSLLTAGRPDPDPMSGLTSDRMRRILNEASSKFDWIVIDTPPVALLPDANLLAAMVDVAVLVVGATRTPHDLVQRAVESIGRDKIMGDRPQSRRGHRIHRRSALSFVLRGLSQ